MARLKISFTPSIRRLPSYLHIIRSSQKNGQFYISGTVIAHELNLEPIQVRKDLAITGIVGKPKKGYPVDALVAAIEKFLGWDKRHNAVVVGAGNLGSALLGYPEFRVHGLHIVTAFDTDPEKIGTKIHGVAVLGTERLESVIRDSAVEYAILTVPSASAQETTDTLVRAGIRAIWNF
ncbi:MAG TPA: redox-sensing transcriptional repressor Rex, partial [Magnetospirillaceae bacterium]|nr:redox-sensing transcriptional repressor Rex [Magnetospirillaceae bacterium]